MWMRGVQQPEPCPVGPWKYWTDLAPDRLWSPLVRCSSHSEGCGGSCFLASATTGIECPAGGVFRGFPEVEVVSSTRSDGYSACQPGSATSNAPWLALATSSLAAARPSSGQSVTWLALEGFKISN